MLKYEERLEIKGLTDKRFDRLGDGEIADQIRHYLKECQAFRHELQARGYTCTTVQNHFSADKRVAI